MDILDMNLKPGVKNTGTHKINKSLVNNVNEFKECSATISRSAASMNTVDMNLNGVKKTKGPMASFMTTVDKRENCKFARIDDQVEKVCKPNFGVQVKGKATSEITDKPLDPLITTTGKRKRCFVQIDDHVAKVRKPTIGDRVKGNVTYEINKPMSVNADEPCSNAATSTSAPSMDAIDMYLKGVKEMGPVASLPTTTSRSCFAQIGVVAKLRKTKTCLEVVKELHDLVKQDGSLKRGHRSIKRYIRLLDMDLPGGDHSSIRDACLVLDPLLNTNDLSKIGSFMRHRGLHVLYEMLRYFLPIFEGRPVLRKIMKTLQHLHDCKVLDVEHLQCDVPRFCMLKFSKLLFDLSTHEDLEVRSMACSFQGLRFAIPKRHPSHAKCLWWEHRKGH